jgi:hypothetical protein
VKDVRRNVLEPLCDAVAVLGAGAERFEDQQVEGAREEFRRICVSHRLSMGGYDPKRDLSSDGQDAALACHSVVRCDIVGADWIRTSDPCAAQTHEGHCSQLWTMLSSLEGGGRFFLAWRTRFGGSPDILGRIVTLQSLWLSGGESHVVICFPRKSFPFQDIAD